MKCFKFCERRKNGLWEEGQGTFEFSVGITVLCIVCLTVSYALLNVFEKNIFLNALYFLSLISGFFAVLNFVFHFTNEKHFRYRITAYKDVTKGNKRKFKSFYVYLDKFYVDADGHFFIDTKEDKEGPYLGEGSSNSAYYTWHYNKNLLWKYDFYTEIYDTKEKCFLKPETIYEKFYFDNV